MSGDDAKYHEARDICSELNATLGSVLDRDESEFLCRTIVRYILYIKKIKIQKNYIYDLNFMYY